MGAGVDRTELLAFLKARSGDGGLVPLGAVTAAAATFSLAPAAVEKFLLENGLFPLRYQRQRQLFGAAGQLRLLKARLGLVGCGGLGGVIFELLVRVGVGRIVAVDPDCFTESNLNRQFLCRPDNLGRPKAEVAREEAARLNPAVEVRPLVRCFQAPEARAALAGCDLVFDGLDSVAARRELAGFCAEHGLFLVHGAVSGWCGQVGLVAPGGDRLAGFYPAAGNFLEDSAGDSVNLAPTVAAVAALQVARGLRFLLAGAPVAGSQPEPAGVFLDLSGPELESWF